MDSVRLKAKRTAHKHSEYIRTLVHEVISHGGIG